MLGAGEAERKGEGARGPRGDEEHPAVHLRSQVCAIKDYSQTLCLREDTHKKSVFFLVVGPLRV